MLSYRTQKPYTSIKGESLALGVLLSRRKFSVEWRTMDNVSCVINYAFRTVTIFFRHYHEYKIEFKFHELHNGEIKFNKRADSSEFLMSLKHPPAYWCVSKPHPDIRKKHWTRVTHIPFGAVDVLSDLSLDKAGPGGEATSIDNIRGSNCLGLGSWTVIYVNFSQSGRRGIPRKKVEEALDRGRGYHLFRKPPFHYFDFRIVTGAFTHPHCERTRLIGDFNLLYSLESAIQSHRLVEQTLDTDFYTNLLMLKPDVAIELLRFMWGGIHADRSPEDIMEEDESNAIDKDEEHKRVSWSYADHPRQKARKLDVIQASQKAKGHGADSQGHYYTHYNPAGATMFGKGQPRPAPFRVIC
ncbi:hypothetical protein BCR43DRAFT_323216 [Syncephalastrum racemosum]|uniref:Uncharacterized protein n=1 Tax=Syncephalastrum racemosum TaxID=13706 RepID=A0A1X2H7J0_SYNRA|nr:hypothetical protein BCR43DRAFT_323216 [Syncephalastrum racemosum]